MLEPNLHSVSALNNVTVRKGVELRPLLATDGPAILQILDDDPTIRERVWVASAMKSQADVEEQVLSAENEPTLLRYVIVENKLVVGMMTFWRAGDYFGEKADKNDYGFGYFLAPSARGRGLVTDSLKVLMERAEQVLGATSFIAFCEADNVASGALLKKAGLHPTGETWTEPDNGWLEQKYQRKL